MVELEVEYKRWLLIKNIVRLINPSVKNVSKRQKISAKNEFTNIIGRWVISMANSQPKKKKDLKDAIFRKTTIANKINQKMLGEMREKGLFQNDEKRIKVVKEILSQVNLFLKDLSIPTESSKITPFATLNNVVFRYKDFSKSLSIKRVRILRRELEKNGIGMRKRKEQNTLITSMLLRYASLVSKGQQWALPLSVYKRIFLDFNGRIEGFASPINSQILSAKGAKDASFCSLFPDTDKPFSSHGSFFDLKLKNIPKGVSLIANPPYVPDVMENFWIHSQKLINEATKKKRHLRIMGILPYWKGLDPIEEIPEYKYTTYTEILKPTKHFYEDLSKNRERIISHFPSFFYVIETESKKKTKEDYSTLTKSMRV